MNFPKVKFAQGIRANAGTAARISLPDQKASLVRKERVLIVGEIAIAGRREMSVDGVCGDHRQVPALERRKQVRCCDSPHRLRHWQLVAVERRHSAKGRCQGKS